MATHSQSCAIGSVNILFWIEFVQQSLAASCICSVFCINISVGLSFHIILWNLLRGLWTWSWRCHLRTHIYTYSCIYTSMVKCKTCLWTSSYSISFQRMIYSFTNITMGEYDLRNVDIPKNNRIDHKSNVHSVQLWIINRRT